MSAALRTSAHLSASRCANDLGTSALGAVPIVGDAGKALIRGGRKVAKEAAEGAAWAAAKQGVEATGQTIKRSAEQPRGVYFLGDDVKPYIDRSNATLGQTGNAHFFMSLEDAANIRSVGDAARASGNARSITDAYKKGRECFGVSFPLGDMPTRVPTEADANGWAHFFGGGRTAVRTPDSNGGFLLNTTRELVTPGGNPMPKGSVLFQIGPDGTQTPLRRF